MTLYTKAMTQAHLTMQSIANTLYDTLDPNFIGIFLYGSQNYELSTNDSDIDAILLVVNANSDKTEINSCFGKIKIYTLQYFLRQLKKGDLECLEILYTKHRYLNTKYQQVFDEFSKEFSSVLQYERTKNALKLKLEEHLNFIFWSANKTNEYYNKKRLYWAIRVQNQLERICNEETFESSLIYQSQLSYDLLKIKQNSNYL